MIIELDYKKEEIICVNNNHTRFIDMTQNILKEKIERYYGCNLDIDKIVLNKDDKIIETHTKNHIRLLYY
jgi:hypothetical protein